MGQTTAICDEDHPTLEATCAALSQLEQNTERFAPLLAAFDGFVGQQLAYRTR